LRAMLFSSKENFLYTARYFLAPGHEFFITPLIPNVSVKKWKKHLMETAQPDEKDKIFPIILKTPDRSFRNLLNPFILLEDFISIFSILNLIRPDVIICFYLLDAYPLVILKSLLNYKLYVVATGSDVNSEKKLDRLVRQFIYPHCDMIFATSNELKEKIEREHHSNVKVSPSGADPHFFRPIGKKANLRSKWGIRKKDVVILTVCRLVKSKGVDIVIRALNSSRFLRQRDVKLLVVGDGPDRHWLDNLVAKLKIRQKVLFLGAKSRSELLELYNLADIFILASYSEGLPRVVAEAMACGCVSISSDVGDVSRMISDGFNGFIVKPRDPENLAEKIDKVLSLSQAEIRLLKKRARRTIMDNFDRRKSAKEIVNVIIGSYKFRRRLKK
jgi:glycosyltransferase involved in cell wall biosynthesis